MMIVGLVDHLAQSWMERTCDAKDMGSFVTMCLLSARGVLIGALLVRAIALT